MSSATQPRSRVRRDSILLGLVFLISLPAVTTRVYSSDEIQYFAYLRSLWFDRDLSFENEYQYFYDHGIAQSQGFHETFLERRTEAGRRVNFGTIGCAMLWSPFYAIGDLAARAGGAPTDGFSRPYIAAVAYGSAIYGFLAIVVSVACAEALGLRATGAALAIWLGTPILFYMYVAPPFSHACSAFAVALFVWTWLRVRRSWSVGGAIALGAAGALMAMVREQDVFFLAGPAVDLVWELRGPRVWQRLAAAISGTAAFAVAFLPQAISYLRLNGHLGPSRLVTRKMSWHAPHALQVLFSPEHGFFVWTPLALIAIAGLIGLAVLPPKGGSDGFRSVPGLESVPVASGLSRKFGFESVPVPSGFSRKLGFQSVPVASGFSRKLAVCMLLMIALQVYVGGSVESWTVAGAFGQRRFVALTSLLIIGLAAWFTRLPGPRKSIVALAAALAVYWNLALIAEFATGLMDRQRLEPVKNAYDAFVTLPRQAPSLAYRYLFDRGSFYQKTPAP